MEHFIWNSAFTDSYPVGRHCSCSGRGKTYSTTSSLSLWKQSYVACDCCNFLALWANYLFCLWKGGTRMNVLTIQNLSKSFGKQWIIDNLHLSVPEGSVFGFIGKNGAGKLRLWKWYWDYYSPTTEKSMSVMSLFALGRHGQINIWDICRTSQNFMTIWRRYSI